MNAKKQKSCFVKQLTLEFKKYMALNIFEFQDKFIISTFLIKLTQFENWDC